MAQLRVGQLDVSRERLEITGMVSRAGMLRAERALRKRPAITQLVRRLEIYDDGLPFYLLAEFDGADVEVRGKIPYGVNVPALTSGFDALRSDGLVQAEITDGARDWTGALATGLAGLREMQHGRLMVAPGSLHLSGRVATLTSRRKLRRIWRASQPNFCSHAGSTWWMTVHRRISH